MAYNQATDLLRGNHVFIYVDNKPIAYAKSTTLSLSADSIDVTSKFSGQFKSALQGQISYTISSDFLFTNVDTATSGSTSFDSLMATMISAGTVTVVIGTSANSTTFALDKGLYTGVCSIKSLDMKTDDKDVASCSVQLEGVSALTKVTV